MNATTKSVFFPFLISLTLILGIPYAHIHGQSQKIMKKKPLKAKVMVLGTYHFNNPNRDAIKITGPDVLLPKYQKQIKQVVDSLAKFEPTKIAVEAMPDDKSRIDSLYQSYLNGKHALSRSELQQLGFRLAKRLNHQEVYSIDHHGAFPFKKVNQFAQKHEPSFIRYFQDVRSKVKKLNDSLFQHATIQQILRQKNSPSGLALQRDLYARIAGVGNDTSFVGANLVSHWHKRNIKIFGDLARITKSGDHIIVIFGAGHAPLLRYFVKSSSRMEFVDPLDYL